MIGGSTDKNPQLSFEQMQSLATYQAQVSNFQHEISIAAQTLSSTRLELEAVEKHLAYQNEISEGLVEDIKKLEERKEVISSDIANATQQHADIIKESQELSSHCSVKEQELSEREHVITEREEEYQKKVIELTSQSMALTKEKEAIDAAKEAFSKALDVVTW